MPAIVAAIIAIACITFCVAMVVIVLLDWREEKRTPPVAHVESGSNHMREI